MSSDKCCMGRTLTSNLLIHFFLTIFPKFFVDNMSKIFCCLLSLYQKCKNISFLIKNVLHMDDFFGFFLLDVVYDFSKCLNDSSVCADIDNDRKFDGVNS